jgi:hypothetical protein
VPLSPFFEEALRGGASFFARGRLIVMTAALVREEGDATAGNCVVKVVADAHGYRGLAGNAGRFSYTVTIETLRRQALKKDERMPPKYCLDLCPPRMWKIKIKNRKS